MSRKEQQIQQGLRSWSKKVSAATGVDISEELRNFYQLQKFATAHSQRPAIDHAADIYMVCEQKAALPPALQAIADDTFGLALDGEPFPPFDDLRTEKERHTRLFEQMEIKFNIFIRELNDYYVTSLRHVEEGNRNAWQQDREKISALISDFKEFLATLHRDVKDMRTMLAEAGAELGPSDKALVILDSWDKNISALPQGRVSNPDSKGPRI